MIVALAGGVGGARLANGLAAVVPAKDLCVAVNTGDDFEHLGLVICPDIDTVTYTLADRNDRERGWGIRDETWSFMASLKELGGADWFALGDRDLAKHVVRTERLRRGDTLTAVTRDFARTYGIGATILPISDDSIRSMIDTDEGELAFQDYFVRRRCAPVFRGIRYDGADTARAQPALLAALSDATLQAIVICPSNPVLSIGPILAVEAIRARLRHRHAPCIAVSPFIGGEAVKGPAAKIMRELGVQPGAAALTAYYAGLVDAILCDHDDPSAGQIIDGVALIAADTLMSNDAGQERLARAVIKLAESVDR